MLGGLDYHSLAAAIKRARSLILSSGYVNVKDAPYNAVGDGVANDTAAIQAALDTGRSVFIPAGTYLVTAALLPNTKGQMIFGEGRVRSIIKVTSAFNLSALGVFVSSTGEEGPQFRDLKVQFTQPDTAVRANLTAYPPAFYLRDTPRFSIKNCMVTNAITGIDMKGNSGGSTIDDLEISAHTLGVDIDGSLDSVRLSKFHYWPFDLTTNQNTIFQDGNNIGIKSGRADDLHISDCLFINKGATLKLIQTGGGVTFGNVTNTDFDNHGGLVVQAGQLAVSSCYFSCGAAADQAVVQTGGALKLSACEFEAAVALTNPMISLSGTATASSHYLQIANCMLQITGDMKAVDAVATSGSPTVILTGNQFFLPQNSSPANAVVHIRTGARLTAIGNRAMDKGTGTGNLIKIDVDDQHIVANNSLVGWTISYPSGYAFLSAPSGPWISYTPSVVGGTGSITTSSATGKYYKNGQTVFFQATATITTNGTGATYVGIGLPIVPIGDTVVAGRLDTSSNASLVCKIVSADSVLRAFKYDGTYPAVNGSLLNVSGFYEVSP